MPQKARYSIRVIWGIAKSPELLLTDDELYDIVGRETGKQKMHDLSQSETEQVCRVLQGMKDGRKRAAAPQKRTDTGGRPETVGLRQKIYRLTGELGWNNDNKRINGLCKRVCSVERVEWLTIKHCQKVIHILDEMIAREEAKDAREEI